MGFGSTGFGAGAFGSWGFGAAAPPALDSFAGLLHVTGRCRLGFALLIEQYRGKPRIETLLCIYLSQIQELEDALWQVWTDRILDRALGAQLDALGAIVGRPRNGLADADYRAWIRAQILVNRSDGSADDLIDILRAVCGATAPVELHEFYPAEVVIDAGVVPTALPSVMVAILRAAKAGGVRLVYEYSELPLEGAFRFADEASPDELDEDTGFGSTLDGAVGGTFAGAMA